MSAKLAILAHSNSESRKQFILPKGVRIIKLGKLGSCLFNSKEYTNVVYNLNTLEDLKLPYSVINGNGLTRITNSVYEMSNINPNTGKTNNLLSGVFPIPLPFPRRTINNRITFNTVEEIREAKNKHSVVSIKRSTNKKGTDRYSLSQLIKKFHKKGKNITFVVYACQAFNKGEFTMNNNNVIRSVSSYTVRYRRLNNRLVTKQIQFGENALRRQYLKRYTNTLRNKLGYIEVNNVTTNINPGEYSVTTTKGRNSSLYSTRAMPSRNELKEMLKQFQPVVYL
jgi:hypothetical protein